MYSVIQSKRHVLITKQSLIISHYLRNTSDVLVDTTALPEQKMKFSHGQMFSKC